MTKIRLAFVHEFRDRHGTVRRYVRLPGRKKVPLPGAPGTEMFMATYATALADEAPPAAIGASRTIAGTVNAAVISYFNSATFQVLAFDTRRTKAKHPGAMARGTRRQAHCRAPTESRRTHGRGQGRHPVSRAQLPRHGQSAHGPLHHRRVNRL